MIKIDEIHTCGWQGAILGMRNSYQSRDNSDTDFSKGDNPELGPKDLALASKLAKAGTSYAKFRRMIHVQCDILAPLYWWKEFDTYKVGTTANSTSTMHSIMNHSFSTIQFSIGTLSSAAAATHLIQTVKVLNDLRDKYKNETNKMWKDIYWNDVIAILPESYNQLRTVDLNYEVISHICKERHDHKLKEWGKFCEIMHEKLPYAQELIFCSENESTDAE